MPLGAFRLNSLGRFTAPAALSQRTAKTVTSLGNAKISTAQSKFGGASGLFDGTGDRLDITSSNDLAFGTGAFTIEFWVRFTSRTGNQVLIDFRDSNNSSSANILFGSDGGSIYLYVNGAYVIGRSGTQFAADNTWYHVALSRSGTSTKAFVDGTQVLSTYTDSTSYIGTAPDIGEINSSFGLTGFGVKGYLDEFRISNSARYTANFTAPTAAFTNDSNTLLLIHCDGSNNTQFFYDDNGTRSSNAITAIGDAYISTAQSKFNGASVLFDDNGDYLTVNDVNTGNFSSDFTIEWWMYTSDTEGEFMACQKFNTAQGWGLVTRSNNRLIWISTTNGSGSGLSALVSSNNAYTNNTWTHAAVCHNYTSGLTELFANGVRVGSRTETNPITVDSGGLFTIGGNIYGLSSNLYSDGPRYYGGHLDEIRISDTVRYTGSTYTIPTAAFTNDSNTLLLIHCDGAKGSRSIIDDNGVTTKTRTAKTITANGNAQISTAQSKFGDSSALLDGNGDYLTFDTSGGNFTFGTNNWTAEMWIRFDDVGANYELFFDMRPFGSASAATVCLYEYNGALYYYSQGGDRISGGTVVANTWYHVAISRSGNDHKLFLNGTQIGSTYTNTNDITSVNANSVIGGISSNNVGDSGYIFKGYMDEIRISNTARYTANFTAPTTAFINDTNTLLLIHADGANTSNTFIDDVNSTYLSTTGAPDMTFITSATSSVSTITIPSTAAVGDIAVLFDYSTTTTDTTPTGFTQVNTATTTGIRTSNSYKILVTGDSGASITGMAGTTRKIIAIFRPATTVRSVVATSSGAQATTATPTNQTLGVATNSLVSETTLGFAQYGATAAITTRTGAGMSEIAGAATTQYAKYIVLNSGVARSNITIGQTDNGTNALTSFYLKFNQ